MTHARFTALVLARPGPSDEGTLLCAGIDRRVITRWRSPEHAATMLES
jgi:hypothetical protein